MSEVFSLPRDVSNLLSWLEEAPPGTLVPAVELAERIRALPVFGGAAVGSVSQQDEPDSLLTAEDVAEWLKVDKHRVYAMARDGRLKKVNVGPNTVRFRREVVEALINRSAQ